MPRKGFKTRRVYSATGTSKLVQAPPIAGENFQDEAQGRKTAASIASQELLELLRYYHPEHDMV